MSSIPDKTWLHALSGNPASFNFNPILCSIIFLTITAIKPNSKGFDNLDITNLMELDVHILNSRSVDYSTNYDLRFLKIFELEYMTNERKYTKIA